MADEGGWEEVPARTKKQQRRQPQDRQQQQQQGTRGRHRGVPHVAPPALVPRPQTVIVLVGTPGCGKSTFCQVLDGRLASNPAFAAMPTPIRVSQDDLGNRKACEALAEAALRAGHNIVIDRCNFDEPQRATWLNIGKSNGCIVVAAFLNTPNAVCKQRVMKRTDHPTLGPTHESMKIVERFRNMLRPPRRQEGFSLIVEAKDDMPSVEAAAATLADRLFGDMAGAAPAPEPAPAAAANTWQASGYDEDAALAQALAASLQQSPRPARGAPARRTLSTQAMEGLLAEPSLSAAQRAALAASLGSASSSQPAVVQQLQRTASKEQQALLDGELRALNCLKAATSTPEYAAAAVGGHVSTQPENAKQFVSNAPSCGGDFQSVSDSLLAPSGDGGSGRRRLRATAPGLHVVRADSRFAARNTRRDR